ncbi:MAG: hypothetical protein ACM3TN_14040 [Alphaproteobacteria bacterium]
MKKIFFLIGFLLLAVAMFLIIPCHNRLFAVSGCCKERNSPTGAWSKSGKDYEACRRYNQQRDNDDVSKPTGFVWWDFQCS